MLFQNYVVGILQDTTTKLDTSQSLHKTIRKQWCRDVRRNLRGGNQINTSWLFSLLWSAWTWQVPPWNQKFPSTAQTSPRHAQRAQCHLKHSAATSPPTFILSVLMKHVWEPLSCYKQMLQVLWVPVTLTPWVALTHPAETPLFICRLAGE